WETESGLINAIGLDNVGVEDFERSKLAYLREIDCAVVVNFFAESTDGYAQLARTLGAMAGVDALEANISCPNVKAGGREFGIDPAAAADVTMASREATNCPLIVKLSPDVSNIGDIASAVENAGADAITVANSVPAMAIDIDSRQPRLSFGRGGLTGPAVRPIVTRLVYDSAQATNIPIIASGGASTWRDVVEFMLAGASAVQAGTVNFVNPRASVEMAEGLEMYCQQHGINSLNQLVGAVDMP
ncbi:MAG: dihydroorotate dehydrogenase, partial [Pseudomonadota bacterium]|nr:dihydroorotate dehydrogenase [Pseudomonadota bacterium]